MKNTGVFAVLMSLVNCVTASANDGPLDIGFGFLGQTELAPTGVAADSLGTLQLRIDGKQRIVGCVRTVNGSNVPFPWLFRLSANGATDLSFAGTGSKYVALPAGATGLACEGFDVTSDGRIVLASFDGGNQYIMRFLENGSADTSFNGTGTLKIIRTGSTNDFIRDAVVAPDGSIYIAYLRITANGDRFLVRHILAGGTVDSGFGPGAVGETLFDGFAIKSGITSRDDQPNRILVGSAGKIVIAGQTQATLTGNADCVAARLDSSGLPDAGFGTAGAVIVAFDLGQSDADRCFDAALDLQGRLVMAGYAQRVTAGDYDFAVIRLTPSGSPDATFSGDGKTIVAFNLGGSGEDIGTAVGLQSDGRIVIGGYAKHVTGSSGSDWAVARLLEGGTLDTTFGAAANGKQTYAVNLGGSNDDFMYKLVRNGSGFVIAGISSAASSESVILARIRTDLIFTDAFGN